MSLVPGETRAIPYLRLFPWLRLLRNFSIATDGRKLILSAFGLALIWAGWDALDRLFPGSVDITPPVSSAWPVIDHDGSIRPIATAFGIVSDPARVPPAPFFALFGLSGGNARFLHASLAAVWSLLVWGLIGGAISRVTVAQVAAGERIGIVPALRFSLGKIISLTSAPLSPLAGVAFFSAFCALFGLLYQIPGPVGATIGGVLAFLPLLAGLLMALIAVGVGVGWPLMVAGVAAEAKDGFDAVSRAYSYVFQRPGRYAAYVGLSWVLGALGFLFIAFFAGLVVHFTVWALSLGGPDGRILSLYGLATTNDRSLPATLHATWMTLVGLLAYGWVYSYFWTAATQIYLLLRFDVDGAAWEDVAVERRPVESFEPRPDRLPKDPAPTPAVAEPPSA